MIRRLGVRGGLALAIAVACSSCARTVAPMATPADVARAAERWPDTSDVELNRGRDVLVRSCGGCHLTPMPSDITAADWPGVLDEMAPEAELDDGERQALERYLVTLTTRTPS